MEGGGGGGRELRRTTSEGGGEEEERRGKASETEEAEAERKELKKAWLFCFWSEEVADFWQISASLFLP